MLRNRVPPQSQPEEPSAVALDGAAAIPDDVKPVKKKLTRAERALVGTTTTVPDLIYFFVR